MKALFAALLLCPSCGGRAQDYRLPFDGRWFARGFLFLEGSPVDGEVLRVTHELPDNPLVVKDERNPPTTSSSKPAAIGACFSRTFNTNRSSCARVNASEAATRSASAVNSGNSDFPHIHMHVQDTAVWNEGTGQNMVFAGIDLQLTGKQFRKVDR